MMMNACLIKQQVSIVSILTAETKHLWHFSPSLHNLLYAGFSNHCLSLAILICPSTLLVSSNAAAFKEHPGARKDDTDRTVLTQRLRVCSLQRCHRLNGAMTFAEIKRTAVTDGMSSMTMTSPKTQRIFTLRSHPPRRYTVCLIR